MPVIEHLVSDERVLTVVAMDRAGAGGARIPDEVAAVWRHVTPHMATHQHLAVFRDMAEAAIDSDTPGGFCFDPHELYVSLPSWNVANRLITASVAHELHHMARWGHHGVAHCFGDALVSEGFATLFEAQIDGAAPPWASQAVSRAAIDAALELDWAASDGYEHAAWFFDGPHGRWLGYSLAFRLATAWTEDSGGFDIGRSIIDHEVATFRSLLEHDPQKFADAFR